MPPIPSAPSPAKRARRTNTGAQPATSVESGTRKAEGQNIPTAPPLPKRSRVNDGAGPGPHALVS